MLKSEERVNNKTCRQHIQAQKKRIAAAAFGLPRNDSIITVANYILFCRKKILLYAKYGHTSAKKLSNCSNILLQIYKKHCTII